MKKDRNTFFSSANMSQSSYMPNMIPNNMPNMVQNGYAPYQEAQASQSFYAGPNPNGNMNYETDYSSLDNRLSKIERQINRLDSRITRLENANNLGNVTNNINESNYSNSMYMV